MRACAAFRLVVVAALNVICVAQAAFSAAHLHWAFLTQSLPGNDGGCGAAFGKDVQEVGESAYDAQVVVLEASYLYNDGVRCKKWARYADARWLTVSSKGDWEGDALMNVGTQAQKSFGRAAVAWATAHSTGGSENELICGSRSISRLIFVRADSGDSGSLSFDGREIRIESDALYVFVEEGDGRLCGFSGWTDAPNKRVSGDEMVAPSLPGGKKRGVRVGALVGGLIGVLALAGIMYGATMALVRRERRREARETEKLSSSEEHVSLPM
ncbi:hypothetical protein BWQ96_03006 [Gracilariopsis chorda]|uniref:Uncharacterized protein n=1 Tax=Gracilariopsis chorda TaxID=448386 RepID=A0A2V3IYN2_9FLOR|nr:hypothetical protein BWQ96_03006 [Gracilariopsis chorda]|eukprot:PXF47231.1 hypothetical protein BWQ96_03006 [Gracilariopsis chorda]